MSNLKALVIGFLGMRPAVVYACIKPLLPWIQEQYGGCDIRLAATKKESDQYLPKLKAQFSEADLCFQDAPIFDGSLKSADFKSQVLDQILAGIEQYAAVILFLKGGKREWDLSLLHRMKCPDADAASIPYFIITSDSDNVVLSNASGDIVFQNPLASLGLENLLALMGFSLASRDGVRTLSGGGAGSLDFVWIGEEKGFLSGVIDARGWRTKKQIIKKAETGGDPWETPYQERLRESLATARRFGIGQDRSRIGFLVDNTLDPIRQRLSASNIRFKPVKPGENIADDLQELVSWVQTAKPGGIYQRNRDGDWPQRYTCFPDALPACSNGNTLAFFVSPRPSDISLRVLYTHAPQNLVLCYDKTTSDTVIQTRRLIVAAGRLGCKQVATIQTDHIGGNLRSGLEDVRRNFNGAWDIQLHPGTKEQGQSLLGEGYVCASDRLWTYHPVHGAVPFAQAGNPLPPVSPPLLETALYLGGELVEKPLQIDSNYVTDARKEAVMNVMSSLASLDWKAENANPQVWLLPNYKNGNLTFKKDREKKKLNIVPLFGEFKDKEGKEVKGAWFEIFSAIILYLAGADEVYAGLKWAWRKQTKSDKHRDDIDVAARFGTEIVAVSCKTGRECYDRGKLKAELCKHDQMARENLGTFVRSFVALPVPLEEHMKSEFPVSTVSGFGTGILDANRLSRPQELRNWLFTKKL